ncbi:MAG: FG-GAP repeat protein [Planctomycetota bacterium]
MAGLSRFKASFVLLLMGLLAQGSHSSLAQCELDKLFADVPTTDEEFGLAVAIGGNYVAVGAPRDDDRGADAGAVYVFERVGIDWVKRTKITATDGAEFDLFGSSVGISSEWLVVGAPAEDTMAESAGAVYVFRRSGNSWTQFSKLNPINGLEDDEFGLSVSLSGDYFIAGARTDAAGNSSGSAYVYRWNGISWRLEREITPVDASEGDQFGFSVALSGDLAVIGARFDDEGGTDSGSTYLFRRSGTNWLQETKLLAMDNAIGDEFGVSVGTDGLRVIVGSRMANQGTEVSAGAAYIFHKVGANWVQQDRVTAPDAADNDQFGISVAIDGDEAIIGSWQDDDAGFSTGAMYPFVRSGNDWTLMTKVIASVPAAQDEFGFAVAIDGDYAVVGSPGDDGTGLRTGSAYLFGVGGDCNNNANPDSCDIQAGFALDFNNDGIPDECLTVGDGDSDEDGDIDLRDVARFQNCFVGVGGGIGVDCEVFDFGPDSDVDLGDYDALQPLLTGP